MPRKKSWILALAGLPLVLLAGAFLVGTLTPREHSATSTAVYGVPPDSVWAAITDFPGMAAWRPDVRSMTPGESAGTWIEEGITGKLTYEAIVQDPGRVLVTRITDEDLPFGGAWSYEVAPAGSGSRLTLTESGVIRPAMFRFMARYLFGYHSTMDGYLKALGMKFGEEVSPEHPDGENR